MQIPRTRGAISGVLLVVLGAWGALVALIGPSFDFTIGPDDTWDLTTGRVLLEVLPGAVVAVGGLMLLLSANRATAALGGWLALAGGVWFIVGPTLSWLWTTGSPVAGQIGRPAGSEGRQVVELLAMLSGLGAAVVALSAFALGRLAVRSVRDVELARERAEAAAEPRFDRDDRAEAPTRVAADDDRAEAPTRVAADDDASRAEAPTRVAADDDRAGLGRQEARRDLGSDDETTATRPESPPR